MYIHLFVLLFYFEGDYGTAHNLTGSRTDVFELGTTVYMAPEMIDLFGMYRFYLNILFVIPFVFLLISCFYYYFICIFF
jgi:hypothetical protein